MTRDMGTYSREKVHASHAPAPPSSSMMMMSTGCADFFRRGITEVGQFTLTKK
jgi:hypothetical protein